MRTQYAAAIDPPPPTLSAISGSLTSQTYNFWLFSRTRAGITNFSQMRSQLSAGGIRVTVPAAVKTSGADIQSIGIVASLTTEPISGCVVAIVEGNTPLPTSVDFAASAHLELNKHLNSSSALPIASLCINGMRRYVDDINKILEYKSATNQWVNASPQVFNPWVASRFAEELDGRRGCDRDLADINDPSTIIFPEYAQDNSYSEAVNYWIVNDGSTTVLQGQRIRMAIATDTFDTVSDDFKGLCELALLGQVDTKTGVLDSSGMELGSFPYQGDAATNFVTPKDLLPGEAIAISVRLRFAGYHLNNRVGQGETVKLYLRIAANYSAYDSASKDLGDRLWDVGGKRRLVPKGKGLFLQALSGSGSVAQYSFELLSPHLVTGLANETSNTNIAISNTGICYPTSSALPNLTAAKRAVVGTVSGPGATTNWSSFITLSPTKLLSLSITHPTAIRADYPDVIAGTLAQLNTTTLRVYVRRFGQTSIQYFDINTIGLDETLLVGTLDTGTLSSLPTVANDFGLFAPPTVVSSSAPTGTSVFVAGSYQFRVGYIYKDTVTSISHSQALGCIREMSGTVVDMLSVRNSWGDAILMSGRTIDEAIRATVPVQDGQVRVLDSQSPIKGDTPLIYYDAYSTESERSTVSDRIWIPEGRAATSGRWKTFVALQGPKGDPGLKGDLGNPGLAATVELGTVTNVGTIGPPTVTNTGTNSAAVFNFGLQRGAAGAAGANATLSVGTVTGLAAGATPTIANVGTASAAIFNFGIPAGAQGANATLSVGAVTGLAAGAAPTIANVGTASAAIFNFGIPAGAQGIQGLKGDTGALGSVGAEGTANFSTGSLAPGVPTIFNVAIAELALFKTLTSSSLCRIRAYNTLNDAQADLLRDTTTLSQSISGLVFDFNQKPGELSSRFSGLPFLSNAESPRTSNAVIVVTNTGNSAANISITLTYYIFRA